MSELIWLLVALLFVLRGYAVRASISRRRAAERKRRSRQIITIE
jgi:hypothetical protein